MKLYKVHHCETEADFQLKLTKPQSTRFRQKYEIKHSDEEGKLSDFLFVWYNCFKKNVTSPNLLLRTRDYKEYI